MFAAQTTSLMRTSDASRTPISTPQHSSGKPDSTYRRIRSTSAEDMSTAGSRPFPPPRCGSVGVAAAQAHVEEDNALGFIIASLTPTGERATVVAAFNPARREAYQERQLESSPAPHRSNRNPENITQDGRPLRRPVRRRAVAAR
ncbi:MAG: hypothetical protein AMXMBFR22_27800 [Phycisphaerae bacterium]